MLYDIIVVGGGPAGLTAALYARRANKTVLVIEKETFGGQITYSPKVENIPGFFQLTGNEFAEKLVGQVMEQGADTEFAEVLSISDGDMKTVTTDSGVFTAKAVIIATGAKHRMLGLANEEKFVGDGISFCAVCDGAFYKDRTIAVIGGGNSALQEALLLSELAHEIIIVQNLDFLTGEGRLIEQVERKTNIRVITGAVVEEILGEDRFEGIQIRRNADGSSSRLSLDGMFVAIGLSPQNGPFKGILPLDERGYATVGEDCVAPTAGVFVAGDCRSKRVRQVTTAVADGAIAALAACDYIDKK